MPIRCAVLSLEVCGAYIRAVDVVVDGCPRGGAWAQWGWATEWVVGLQSSVGVEGVGSAYLWSFTCLPAPGDCSRAVKSHQGVGWQDIAALLGLRWEE